MYDGRVGEGLGYFAGTTAAAATGLAFVKQNRSVMKKSINLFDNGQIDTTILSKMSKHAKLGLAFCALGLGAWVYNIVDAYKGKR